MGETRLGVSFHHLHHVSKTDDNAGGWQSISSLDLKVRTEIWTTYDVSFIVTPTQGFDSCEALLQSWPWVALLSVFARFSLRPLSPTSRRTVFAYTLDQFGQDLCTRKQTPCAVIDVAVVDRAVD